MNAIDVVAEALVDHTILTVTSEPGWMSRCTCGEYSAPLEEPTDIHHQAEAIVAALRAAELLTREGE